MSWQDRIQTAANAGGFNLDRKDPGNDWWAANRWGTCVVGEAARHLMPENVEHGPDDERLRDLGRDFYRQVISHNIKRAAEIWQEVQSRTAELSQVH